TAVLSRLLTRARALEVVFTPTTARNRRGTQLASADTAMAPSLYDDGSTRPSPDRLVHILRWTFRRDEEAVVCELGLNSDDSAYELRVDPPASGSTATTEQFDDAMSALERHAAIERVLVKEGWLLEGFESERVPRRH